MAAGVTTGGNGPTCEALRGGGDTPGPQDAPNPSLYLDCPNHRAGVRVPSQGAAPKCCILLKKTNRMGKSAMSDNRPDENRSWTDTAADTARSASDTARSAAPEAYGRGADAVNYASRRIQEYPLSGSVAMGLLGYAVGFLFHHQWFGENSSSRRGRNDRRWAGNKRSWTDTAADTARSASDTARSSAPEAYGRGADAANYASQRIQEYPLSGSVAIGLLGYALGFLFHHQWFGENSSSRRGRNDRR